MRYAFEEAGSRRGGENVRLALANAACKLLESQDYQTTRVIDLCREASISRATFYLHFDSKGALFRELAAGLIDFEFQLMPTLHDFEDAFDALLALCQSYTDFFSANMYLIEACAYFADTVSEVGSVWAERSERRKTRILRELLRFPEFEGRNLSFSMFVLDTIGRGMNRVMYSIYGRLPQTYDGPEQIADPEHLPELFAGLMYQCLFCKVPPPEKFNPSSEKLAPVREVIETCVEQF